MLNHYVLQDYAQCRFDAYFKQKKLFSWFPSESFHHNVTSHLFVRIILQAELQTYAADWQTILI